MFGKFVNDLNVFFVAIGMNVKFLLRVQLGFVFLLSNNISDGHLIFLYFYFPRMFLRADLNCTIPL